MEVTYKGLKYTFDKKILECYGIKAGYVIQSQDVFNTLYTKQQNLNNGIWLG